MSPSIARTLAALAVALVASAAGSARAADGKLTLAVSDFDNHAASAAYGALEKGLADMLVTDLAVADDLQLVEREKLSAVVEELKLGQSGLIDPKTAQKMGRLLGADLVLTGSIVAIEPEMRLDARIVAVETGEVLATAKAEGASSAFFEVEAALVKNLLDGLGVKLSPIQRLKVDKPATKSLPALARYGEAVAAADKGDGKGEKAALQKALQADPTFARAQERLAALEERLAALEKRTDVVERAGGLVVKPTTAADFWSNHKVHLDRREVAAALTDLQGLLGVAPASLDGLAAYVVNVTATAGKPPAAADVRKVAKGVDAGVVDALGGIAAKDAAAADAATAKLLKARKGDAVARYLRVVALTAPVNPKPTAAERSEELMHLLALADPEAQTALAAAFTAGESLATANALLAARRAYYAEKPDGWGRPRAQLLLPGVALGVKGARTLWVRIAEPNAQGVEVALPGGAVLRPTYDGSGSLDGETTAFSLKLDRKAKYPEGALAVTVRYIDGKKRDVTTKLGLWMPPLVTLGDNNWRSVQIGVPSGEDRPGSLLVDTLARVWTRPAVEDYYGADFSPSWEGLPYAWGIYGVRYRNAAETGTGFARPIALRFTDGGGSLALLGRVEFTWRDKAGERGELATPADSIAQEMGAGGTPWFRYADGYLDTLMQLGDYATAVDLSLDLGDVDGDPERSFRGRLDVSNGEYRWIALLAAATRARHRVAEMAKGADYLRGDAVDTPWLRMLAGAMAGEVPRAEAIARARALDGERREDSAPGRFIVEVAAYLALADGKWADDPALRAVVDEALGVAELGSMEYWLLASLARERAMRDDAPQVKVGGLWVDRWETSADDYLACVAAGACRRPSPSTCSKALGANDDDQIRQGTGSGCWPVEPNPYPMDWIARDHAARYCAWRKGRLPTLAEWRAAAQGAPARPLGDNLLDLVSCELSFAPVNPAICDEKLDALGREHLFDGYLGLAPQGAHPAGRTKAGLEEILGNVAEWVADGDNRAAGCTYHDAPGAVSGEACAQKVTAVPTLGSGLVGFRCVYDGAPPTMSPAAQGKREARAPKTGKPKVAWVKVPAGEIQRGAEVEPVTVSVASPAKGDLAAVAKAVDGLSEGDLARFLGDLRKLGIEGTLDSHRVGELVLRGRYRGMDARKAFDTALSFLEPQVGEDAQRAANERAKELLAVSIYHDGAYSVFAQEHKVDKGALTKAQQRQALFDYMTRYDGNRDANLRYEMAPVTRGPDHRPLWDDVRAPGCLDQAPGACRDITGIKGTVIEDGGFVRQEKVAVGAFEIMPTEVTQAQYLTLTGKDPSYERCPDCPVTQVSATEAAAFCAAVGGRLPTPDEWERAARGKAAVGRDGELGDVAWYVENSGRRPHEVGTKKANGLGLYDLLGNVWEWVADRPDKGNDWRSYIRGGSWGTDSRMVRPERSLGIAGRLTSDFVGFRCAR